MRILHQAEEKELLQWGLDWIDSRSVINWNTECRVIWRSSLFLPAVCWIEVPLYESGWWKSVSFPVNRWRGAECQGQWEHCTSSGKPNQDYCWVQKRFDLFSSFILLLGGTLTQKMYILSHQNFTTLCSFNLGNSSVWRKKTKMNLFKKKVSNIG